MLIKKPSDIRYSEVTPKYLYMNRRNFLAGAAAAAAMTPSKEGLEALEKLKKEGPKPAPQ